MRNPVIPVLFVFSTLHAQSLEIRLTRPPGTAYQIQS
jgi:hypothetical protein